MNTTASNSLHIEAATQNAGNHCLYFCCNSSLIISRGLITWYVSFLLSLRPPIILLDEENHCAGSRRLFR